MERKEHTPFYFNKEVDQALRGCDEAPSTRAIQDSQVLRTSY